MKPGKRIFTSDECHCAYAGYLLTPEDEKCR
jgi:hypothetical protein